MVGVTPVFDTSMATTNLKCDTGKTKDGLRDWVQLVGVNSNWFPDGRIHIGERTSAKTAPYFITLSTTLSVDAPIIGEYFSNNSSSSLSDERRDSPYAKIVSWLGWGAAKGHTEAFAENCNSIEKLRFPMTTTSALLHQV